MPKPLHPMLQPWKPTGSDVFDDVKAAHLLARAGFGGTLEEIARVRELGPSRAVSMLMDFPDSPADEQGVGPDLSAIEGYPSNFTEIRKLYQGKTEQERQRIRQELMRANREAIGETISWWMRRMATGPAPLHEKLVLFWHGHFTSSAREERQASLIWQQNELHRTMAAGNFAKYVKAISRDPAMLDYLNNSQNRKEHPNENYARELMELFTLGRDRGYTEKDIKEAARAFTGWAHDGDEFVFRQRDHDTGPKNFLGRTGNFDGDDVIDIILSHKNCAPYIASRLWNFFAYEPDETLDADMFESLGDVLRENNWELRPLLRTMFTSRAFYSERAMGTQIKSPIQLVVGTVRGLGIEMPAARVVVGQLSQMGQVPLSPPNVKGWPGGRLWINTSTLFVRYNTGVFLAGGEIPDVGRIRVNKRVVVPDKPATPTGFKPVDLAELESPEQMVDYWVKRLVQRPVETEKLATLAESMDGKTHDPVAIRRMIQLIVSMPDYQLC